MPALSQHSVLIPDSEVQNVFNVTEEPYNAVGDGIVDNTDTLNQLIADVNALNEPATIYFPTGDYEIQETLDTITPARVTICGDPGYSTRIVQRGTSGEIIKFSGRFTTITDLYLEASNEVAPDSYAIEVVGEGGGDWNISRLVVWDFGGILLARNSRGVIEQVYSRILEECGWDWFRIVGCPGIKGAELHVNGGKCIVTSGGAYLSIGRPDPDSGLTDVTDGAYFSNLEFFSEPAVSVGSTLTNGTQTLSTTPSDLLVDSTTGFTASGTFNIGTAGVHRTVTYTSVDATHFKGCTISSGSTIYADNTSCRQYVDGANGTLASVPYGFYIDARVESQNNLRFLNYCIDGTTTVGIRIQTDSNVDTARVHHFVDGRIETGSGRCMHVTCAAGGAQPTQNIFVQGNRFIWGNDPADSTTPFLFSGNPTILDEITVVNNHIDQKTAPAHRNAVLTFSADNFIVANNIFGCGSTTATNTDASYWVTITDDSTQFVLGPNIGNPPTSAVYLHYAYTTITNGRHVLGKGSLVGPELAHSDRRATSLASNAVTAAFDTLIQQVEVGAFQKALGIRYRVGTTASGDAMVMLYDAAGNLLANSAQIAQSGANSVESLPFATPLFINPGTYFLAIQLSSGTATTQSGNMLIKCKRVTAGSMAAQSTITPPTTAAANNQPALALYSS